MTWRALSIRLYLCYGHDPVTHPLRQQVARDVLAELKVPDSGEDQIEREGDAEDRGVDDAVDATLGEAALVEIVNET